MNHPGGTGNELHVEVRDVFQGDSGNLETDKEFLALDNQESHVNATKTPPEDLQDKFESPLILIVTQIFISDKDGASYTLDNSYFSNLISFYVGMQDGRTPAVASFVSFSNTKVSSKDKVEHVLTNDCVQLTN